MQPLCKGLFRFFTINNKTMKKLTEQRINKILTALTMNGIKGNLYTKIAKILLRHDEIVNKYHELEMENLLLKTEINTLNRVENQL